MYRIITFSDVHFGKPRIDDNAISERLGNMLGSLEDPISIDYMIIAGDFFDRALLMSSKSSTVVIRTVIQLLNYCSAFKIKLIILEGTNSHDANQSSIFDIINGYVEDKVVYVKYIQKIEYWIDPDTNLKFLAVPDNINDSTFKTRSDIKQLLIENNTDQVDIMITHAMWTHHLPKKALHANRESVLDFKWFNVKYITLNGHIHTSSYKHRILTLGSVDRLAMGEEERKGIWEINIQTNERIKLKFIENKDATLFTTLVFDQIIPLEELFNNIVEYLDGNKKQQLEFLNIKYVKDSIKWAVMADMLRKKYPQLRIQGTAISDDDIIEDTVSFKLDLKDIKIIPITKSTISDLIKDKHMRANSKINVENVLDQLTRYLE